MRTTVTLDADVHAAAMHIARTSGQRLGKVLSILARRGLRQEAPQQRGKRRFPVFDVPKDAPVIPASRIQEALDEESIF